MSMTVLMALKKIKQLGRKIDKTKERIARWCSYLEEEAPPLYTDIPGMIQSVNDMLAMQAQLKHLIHKTNMLTQIEFRGKSYTIDELLLARTVTLPAERNALKVLRRKERDNYNYGRNRDEAPGKVINQYDPKWRDQQVDDIDYMLEEIDNVLDMFNMSTNLVN